MKKALFIGGTGTISTAITERIAAMPDWELYLINRGNHAADIPAGVKLIRADVNDEAAVLAGIGGLQFDCVCDFIGFVPAQVERDWRLFRGRTRQYMYISSGSAYQKPVLNYILTEGTPLANPYSQYARDKMACEAFLMEKYREEGFPVTIIRPTLTYGRKNVPLSVRGNGTWQVLKRMLDGKPVIVHGDGSSLWTITHNTDFAKGFCGLMANGHAIGNAFHITSDEVLSWDQIYKVVADVLGVPYKPYYVSSHFLGAVGEQFGLTANLLGDKACSVVFDNAKLKRAVPDYVATVRFEEGIRESIANILADPSLQVEDPAFDAWCDRVIAAQEAAKAAVLEG
ncbi:MAG: SDR family oxidoreductase [Bacteroidales bacterium]|nr:SDR family oxidoreductase [Bacteroidales bacterium]